MNEEAQEEDREFEEPQRPVDLPLEKNTHKRKPAWALVENERLVTKKMTKIRISMTTFGLAIAGG